MKTSIQTGLLAVILSAGALFASRAQEVLSRSEAMKIAVIATLNEKLSPEVPVKIDTDLKRPLAGHDGEFGVFILPETKLSAEGIEKAGKTPIPIGQLWLRKLTPMVHGEAVEAGKLQLQTIEHDGESHRAALCVLAARRNADDLLELLVYGKGKEPLVVVPLKKADRKQQLPIEMTPERDSDSGKLQLHLAGKFTATVVVTQLDE